jgi:hypothetical protein
MTGQRQCMTRSWTSTSCEFGNMWCYCTDGFTAMQNFVWDCVSDAKPDARCTTEEIDSKSRSCHSNLKQKHVFLLLAVLCQRYNLIRLISHGYLIRIIRYRNQKLRANSRQCKFRGEPGDFEQNQWDHKRHRCISSSF